MRARKILSFLCSILVASAAPFIAFAADADAAKIVAELCSLCHTASARPLDRMHFTRKQWNQSIDRMAAYGAEVPKEKRDELLDYLVRSQAPANAAENAGKK